MIWADLLAGASLNNNNPEELLTSSTRFFNSLPREQKYSFLAHVSEKAS
jgi:hypothetical protein